MQMSIFDAINIHVQGFGHMNFNVCHILWQPDQIATHNTVDMTSIYKYVDELYDQIASKAQSHMYNNKQHTDNDYGRCAELYGGVPYPIFSVANDKLHMLYVHPFIIPKN